LATAVSEKVKRCPDEKIMSSSRQQLSIELPSFIISILASINIPSNQQSGENLSEPRKSEKHFSSTIARVYARALRRRESSFSRKFVFGGKVIYHFWGKWEMASLDAFEPDRFWWTSRESCAVYSSEVGLYMMVVRNWELLVLLFGSPAETRLHYLSFVPSRAAGSEHTIFNTAGSKVIKCDSA
jgi:hypothetical protein